MGWRGLSGWAALALIAMALSAGGPAEAAGYKAPRNSFGQPDLEGAWTNASLTSLVRPARFKSATLTEAEARAFEASNARRLEGQNRPSDPNAPGPTASKDPGGYNSFWIDAGSRFGRINGQARTAWIYQPADGQLPFTEQGRKIFQSGLSKVRTSFEGPESRPIAERCLLGFGSTAGPPMLNVLYNNNYLIQQSKDHVVIVVEMNHDARIIRLAEKGRPPAAIRNWMGDSIGRWEGETLVVETTQFNPGEVLRTYFDNSLYISADARVTERFTRISENQILYQFEVDDPKIYSSVWKAEMPLNATRTPMYEYACHEGNYALPGILSGARAAEKEGRKPDDAGLGEE